MTETPSVTPNAFQGSDVERISLAIEAAAGTGKRVVIPRWNRAERGQTDTWLLGSAILLRSDTTPVLDNCRIKLSDRCRDNTMRSAKCGLGITEISPLHNIHIRGVHDIVCVNRDYLEHHPLAKLRPRDDRPETRRRAMAREEIQKLLGVAPLDRRFRYQMALGTGLRVGELQALRPRHLNVDRCEIDIEMDWDKGRREWHHPVAAWLVSQLADIVLVKPAGEPLLRVPTRPATDLHTDLEAADIPVENEQGYLDFHALRTTYITLVIELGANTKEVQMLARHTPSDLTHRAYIRARDERLHELAEAVGAVINIAENHDPGMAQPGQHGRIASPNAPHDQQLGYAPGTTMPQAASLRAFRLHDMAQVMPRWERIRARRSESAHLCHARVIVPYHRPNEIRATEPAAPSSLSAAVPRFRCGSVAQVLAFRSAEQEELLLRALPGVRSRLSLPGAVTG